MAAISGVYIFNFCEICERDSSVWETVEGCIIYTPGGLMSVQIRWGDGRVASYYGPYTLEGEDIVLHHIEQGADVARTMGESVTQKRRYRIVAGGARIELETLSPVTIDGRNGYVRLWAYRVETL